MSKPTTRLEMALQLASEGWAVIPATPVLSSRSASTGRGEGAQTRRLSGDGSASILTVIMGWYPNPDSASSTLIRGTAATSTLPGSGYRRRARRTRQEEESTITSHCLVAWPWQRAASFPRRPMPST